MEIVRETAKGGTRMNLWNRLQDESPQAYEAFCVFRDLGYGRSVQRVSEKLAKSRTLLDRWCQAHKWRQRADAWDNSVTEQAREYASQELTKALIRRMQLGRSIYERATEELLTRDLDKASINGLVQAIRTGVEVEANAMRDVLNDQKSGFTPVIIIKDDVGEGE